MLLQKHLTHNYSIFEVARKTNYAIKFTSASLGKIKSIKEIIYVIYYNHVVTIKHLKSEEGLFQNPIYLILSRTPLPLMEPNL